jgi:hypothetical protein
VRSGTEHKNTHEIYIRSRQNIGNSYLVAALGGHVPFIWTTSLHFCASSWHLVNALQAWDRSDWAIRITVSDRFPHQRITVRRCVLRSRRSKAALSRRGRRSSVTYLFRVSVPGPGHINPTIFHTLSRPAYQTRLLTEFHIKSLFTQPIA